MNDSLLTLSFFILAATVMVFPFACLLSPEGKVLSKGVTVTEEHLPTLLQPLAGRKIRSKGGFLSKLAIGGNR